MRISFVLPTLGMAGGFRIIAHLAEGLRTRGHEVRSIAVPPAAWKSETRPKLVAKALLGKETYWQLGLGPTRLARAWKSLRDGKPGWTPGPSHFDRFPELRPVTLPYSRPVAEGDVPDGDVVISTWYETAGWVAALSPRKGAKVNFIQQYDANFDRPAGDVDASWRLPMHKIVCARWLADLARTRFGDPEATVATNGVDLDLFDAPPRGKQPRPTVGMMYSTEAPKSWATALAVLIEARRRVPGLRARAFGAMEPTSFLPIPSWVEFEHRPEQGRIAEIYASCDAWLCTSSSEGFHLPPHEAMACRCPVVSTRVGGPMDIVVDGRSGYLADPFDAVTLADRLGGVLTMGEGDWRAMSDEAYAEARRHTWAEATDRFEAGLERAIERTRRGDFAPPA